MSGSGNGVDIGAVYQLLVQVAETLDVHSTVLNSHTEMLNNHSAILNSHTEMLNNHSAILNSHTEMLNKHSEVLNSHSRILSDQSRVLNEHTLMLHDHGNRLTRLGTGMTELRQDVANYHASVMGHGILISELDHRLRRVEEHLNLRPVT